MGAGGAILELQGRRKRVFCIGELLRRLQVQLPTGALVGNRFPAELRLFLQHFLRLDFIDFLQDGRLAVHDRLRGQNCLL